MEATWQKEATTNRVEVLPMMALLLTKTYCCPKERPLGSPKVSRRKFTDRRRYCGFISPLHGFPNGIALEVGRPKNSKKNLFSEHDIEEHGLELLNICPEGDPASLVTLWLATAVVNTHIRSVRPYARERHVLTQLRLLTGEYLATDLTKVTLNQILSQTTFQAFIPGLPA